MREDERRRFRWDDADSFLSGMADGPQKNAGAFVPEEQETLNQEDFDAVWQAQVRQMEEKCNADIRDFFSVFPEAARSPIPQEVWNGISQGLSPTAAYVRYLRMSQQRMPLSSGSAAPAWTPAPFQNASPFQNTTPWTSAPFQNTTPWASVPFQNAPVWTSAPFQNTPAWTSAPFQNTPVWASAPVQNALPASTGSMRSAGFLYGPKDAFLDGLEGDW